MKPVNFHQDEMVLKGGSDDVADLPVVPVNFGYGPALVSCWRLSLQERLLFLLLGNIYLVVFGRSHPPVFLTASPVDAGLVESIKPDFDQSNQR